MDEAPGPFELTYHRQDGRFEGRVPADFLADLVQPWSGKRRAFLMALLNGYSKRAAAAAIGVTPRTTQYWQKHDPVFAEAVSDCAIIGFGCVLEAELYRRAMAGPEDSGSMRALELVLRSRDPRYRNK